LVGEACARLLGNVSVDDRRQFLALAATVMRRVLVDHARRIRAAKRGGGARQVTLDSDVAASGGGAAVDLVALDDAMTRLADLDERQVRIVEMRYLAGMTVNEVAVSLGLSRSSIEAEWRAARAWLRQELVQS
jgi:RNA polymerase sigma-70 factor (ECF subfamily)